jgi:hypothetical protein
VNGCPAEADDLVGEKLCVGELLGDFGLEERPQRRAMRSCHDRRIGRVHDDRLILVGEVFVQMLDNQLLGDRGHSGSPVVLR